jgi:hypothetical protein
VHVHDVLRGVSWCVVHPHKRQCSCKRAHALFCDVMMLSPYFFESPRRSAGGLTTQGVCCALLCCAGERSDILAGMLPMSPGGSSSTPRSPGSLDAYKTHQPDKDRHDDYQW